jgi:hypothetical protein
LAAKVGGPLLLTEPASLDGATQAELTRVLTTGGAVYVVGGIGASVRSPPAENLTAAWIG